MSASKSSNSPLSKIILLLLPVGILLGALGINNMMASKSKDSSAEVLDTSSAEALVVSLKRPLAEATEALADQNFMRAKRELGEFQEFWEKVGPMFKAKVPDAYQQVNQQFSQVKSSLDNESPQAKKVTAEIQQLSQTVEKNAGSVLSGQKSTPVAVAKSEPVTKLTSEALAGIKKPIADGIKAINDGDFSRAKGNYDEFLALWKKSEDSIKEKSPKVFEEIETGMDGMYGALVDNKKPEKQKAIAAFEQIQTTLGKL